LNTIYSQKLYTKVVIIFIEINSYKCFKYKILYYLVIPFFIYFYNNNNIDYKYFFIHMNEQTYEAYEQIIELHLKVVRT
jgi:hypothetical protein